MQRQIVTKLLKLLVGIVLAAPALVSTAQAQYRPLKKLDTSKGLYIRSDGTRVAKDPAPPRRQVYTYRRKDGRIVRTYTNRRNYGQRRSTAKKRYAKKRSSSRRR